MKLSQIRHHPLAKRLGGHGKSVSYSTVYRWTTRGINGARLSVLHVRGVLCTTEKALAELAYRLTEAPPLPPRPDRTKRQKEIASKYADAVLDSAGF